MSQVQKSSERVAGSYDLYLSYSGKLSYTICPKQYHYKYVLKEAGRPQDPRDTMFGSIIGKVFEWFYEKNIWSSPDPMSATCGLIEAAVKSVFDSEGFNPLADQPYVNKLQEELDQFVPHGLEIIRANKLLSQDSRAEVDLTQKYSSKKHGITLKLGGRADFVHRFDADNMWILDGKASAHRDLYTDSDQVVWYAMLHYLKYGVAPTRVGFIYWRFPESPLKWVDYDADSIRTCSLKTFDVAGKILNKQFDPTPSKACQLCSYSSKCGPGGRHLAELRVANGGRIENPLFELVEL